MPQPTDGFVGAVLAVVDAIPPGRVMTYGDVAAVLGSRGARAVGQVMSRYGHTVPWWRVIRAGGHPPAGKAAEARPHYDAEGVPIRRVDDDDGYRIDLAACRWHG